ncbi:MAG: phosphatidate cytidylyltransferase [Chloroflexi bacterium]|nr:phosphatidate cytidylyltransferase [Chloroflexota bacterium]MCL5075459.1 phosphatidate cytidylyltransferase [Chloroflexota bacterium]
MLRRRLLSALILIPVVALSAYMGGIILLTLILVVATIAAYEMDHMLRNNGYQPAFVLALPLALSLIFDAFISGGLLAPLVTTMLLLTLIWFSLRPENISDALVDWALTIAEVLYVGWLLRYAVLIPNLPNGLSWIALTLLSTWGCDTGAYCAGRMFGRHKLLPVISPQKTWEGVYGGLLLSVIATLLVAQFIWMPLIHRVVLGISVGIAAILGDLAESWLKRSVHAKDSGTIIPGHGGLLDRIDSLLFSMPVVYYYATLVLKV